MFQKKDIICFLGDSITANGMWMAEIYQILRKIVPIKCYNCGVSGATAEQATKYLHSRCLIHNPDYVVMMYGINDIWRGSAISLMNSEGCSSGLLAFLPSLLVPCH